MPTRRKLTGAELAAYVKRHHRLRAILKRLNLRVKVAVLRARRVPLSKRTLRIAAKYVGVKEYPAGSNLTMFGKWYGWNGVAWCAIFVSFVLSHAGRPFKYAYVPAIVSDAIAGTGGLSIIPAAQVNAALAAGHPVLACFDWEHDGTADHVGLAKHVDLAVGTVDTVEGNTGNDDWSNGGEVCQETRPLALVQAFVKVA